MPPKASCLKIGRRIAASAVLAFFVLAFLNPAELAAPLAYAAKLQFGQLTAALVSAGALYAVPLFAAYAALTALFGRFFCACLCPLGAALDLAGALRAKARPKRYGYRPDAVWRKLVPAIALALFWAGATLPFGILEPYSVLASRSLLWGGPPLVLLAVLASGYFRGRAFCNSLCPAGLLLSLFARFSRGRLGLTARCNGCGRCSRACPASCIDHHSRFLDHRRCVLCLECLDACREGAIAYSFRQAPGEGGGGYRPAPGPAAGPAQGGAALGGAAPARAAIP
ncbi:MAG: 4Fe-4S binding protein, partial [Deltaproteobacteria bacterium]|nr:4Fe-4S binding protein [Deltaproteobacteria bacterium]